MDCYNIETSKRTKKYDVLLMITIYYNRFCGARSNLEKALYGADRE